MRQGRMNQNKRVKRSPQTVGGIVLMLLRGVFITGIILICLLPILWVLTSSFKTNADIISGTLAFPHGIKFSNYVKAFQMAPLARFYINSIVIAVVGTALNLVVMGMAAYVVARFQFRFKNVLKLLFSSVLFIPCAALLYPLYVTIHTLKMTDSYMGLILVYAGLGMATSFYIIMSYYLTVPKALEEAASIDGAGFFRTYVSIILPISKPCFASAGVLQFLLCWNEFQFALTLTTGNKVRTLPIALYYFTSQFSSDYGSMMAATILVALPSIILYVALQKQVVSGLVSGSVKG